jgi:hypothetical protein
MKETPSCKTVFIDMFLAFCRCGLDKLQKRVTPHCYKSVYVLICRSQRRTMYYIVLAHFQVQNLEAELINMVYGTEPYAGVDFNLTLCPLQSRSNTFTMCNTMPESTLT